MENNLNSRHVKILKSVIIMNQSDIAHNKMVTILFLKSFQK